MKEEHRDYSSYPIFHKDDLKFTCQLLALHAASLLTALLITLAPPAALIMGTAWMLTWFTGMDLTFAIILAAITVTGIALLMIPV